jgi:predicted nucleic acid-binding protein
VPIYYLDSSGLVKAYVAERGSERVVSLVRTERVVVSMVASAEVASALARRAREGTLAPDEREAAFRTFMRHSLRFETVMLTQRLVERASEFLRVSSAPLRTLDAIHLATAEQSFILARQAGEDGVLVTADRRLLDAATTAGLTVETRRTTGEVLRIRSQGGPRERRRPRLEGRHSPHR